MASEEPDDEGLRRNFSRRDERSAPAVAKTCGVIVVAKGRAGTSYGNPVIRRRDNPVPAVGEGMSSLGSACALRRGAP